MRFSSIIKMLKVSYIFLSLFVLYREISCNEANNRIVNGFVAQRDNFPHQVSLQINGYLHCGGTILDNYHVLTAAHCVKGFNPQVLSIVVGSADLRKRTIGTRYRISGVRVHEKYQARNGWANDIALLKVANPMKFDKYVSPAVLPEFGEYLNNGQGAVVSGFGQIHENSIPSPILYKTQVFIVPNGECQQYYRGDSIRPTNICTRYPNKITGFCRGDSGGPLNVKGKVVGIVSFSLDNGCAGQSKAPQVYTRISTYIDWINYWRKY